jgi:hypothetical protein
MAERTVGEPAPQDGDALFEQRRAMAPVDAERLELLEFVPEAETEAQAAVRQDVHDGGVFGDAQWIVQRQQQDGRPDGHPFGTYCDGGGHREDRRQVVVVDEVVLGEPHRVEAEIFDRRHVIERLRVQVGGRDHRRTRVAKVVQHAEFHEAPLGIPSPAAPRQHDPSQARARARGAHPCPASRSRRTSRHPRLRMPAREPVAALNRHARARSPRTPPC